MLLGIFDDSGDVELPTQFEPDGSLYFVDDDAVPKCVVVVMVIESDHHTLVVEVFRMSCSSHLQKRSRLRGSTSI